jgi:DNA uptake protein ComE-like DNA-binding protein
MKDSEKSHDGGKHTPSASFVIGAIALVFLIIGYQMAIFIHQAAVEKIVANHDHPDTVFVYSDAQGADVTATSSSEQMLKQVQHDQNEGYSERAGQEYSVQADRDYSERVGQEYSAQAGRDYSERAGLGYSAQANSDYSERVGQEYSAQAGRDYSEQVGQGYQGQPNGNPERTSQSNPERTWQEYPRLPNGHPELVSGSKSAVMVPKSKSAEPVSGSVVIRKNSEHSPMAEKIRIANTPRHYECFRFDPNTASIDDLMRLGFTHKQAQSIDNYRKKGGRFRRKSDFAKSYVVEDSVYKRLEPYIDIPRIDLNTADSATFETLPGIGKYFASKMVSYRNALGGYSYPEQLMDIWHFDQEKYDGLKDLIFINPSTTTAYQLWTLPEEQLAKHPYIGRYSAHSIVIFRKSTPRKQWSVEELAKAGILKNEYADKLARCLIAPPE